MKTLSATEITEILLPAMLLTSAFSVRWNMMKIIPANDKAIAWPAIMLAKSRIISANGFVKILTSSITGIKGTGTFNHVGTSGQKISFQYSLVPVKLVMRKVHRAKKQVHEMLPVRLPPPGGKGR